MSNYNDLTKKIYADMSLRGVTLRHIQDLFDLSIIEIRTNRSFDHDAVFRVTSDVKSALKQILAQGRDDKIQELYDHCLLLEAPYLLDSYCLYIEKNRPADERFYEPRRKTLIKVVNALQRLENDEMDEQFIHMPARTGKSMMLTEALAWHACRNTELSNLYVTYTESVASAFLDGIKEIMLDPTYLHRDVFPDAAIVDTDAVAHTLDLGRKKKYKSISTKGLEASLNGAYDARGWVLVDDVIKGVEEVMNPEVLHRKQLLFDNNLMRRRKTGSKVIYNGTIWSLHDMYMDRMRFLQESPEAKHIRWDVLKIPALDPITDESNFDYDYGVGFSTQYYRTERAKFEANEDMAGWYAQFQQEPIERDGALFVPGHLNYYNGVLPEEEPLKIVAACDVALGGSDFLSMPVAYVYEDGSVYVHDVVFDNSEKNITQPEVVEAIVRNNISSAFFEANQGGEGYKQDIGRRLAERADFNNGRGIQLVSKYTPGTKRKEQRIWDNAPAIREMFFLEPDKRNSQYSKFMTNLFSFTINGVSKHKHDDAADSMAMLAQFIQKGSGVRSAKIIHGFI